MTTLDTYAKCRALLQLAYEQGIIRAVIVPNSMSDDTLSGMATLLQSMLTDGPKLKPLEWVDSRFGSKAMSVLGDYCVDQLESFVTGTYYRWSRRRGPEHWFPCDSIEHGKQLCERDYATRVGE